MGKERIGEIIIGNLTFPVKFSEIRKTVTPQVEQGERGIILNKTELLHMKFGGDDRWGRPYRPFGFLSSGSHPIVSGKPLVGVRHVSETEARLMKRINKILEIK